MFLPLFFKSGLSCLVVGGGQVASHKIRILLETSCRVTVIAPQISDYIEEEWGRRSLRWLQREYRAGDCRGYLLVIAATPLREVNLQISEEARKNGTPVNVVDDPVLSTVIFPAIWREKSLSVAVSTGGTAPFLAAEIRTRIARFSRGLGDWAETAGRFRDAVKKGAYSTKEKNALFRRFVDAGPRAPEDAPPEGTDAAGWLSWLESGRSDPD